MTRRRTLAIGCALFTMLFGAGNIIFPLILGRSLGTALPYAIPGLILSGVVIPFIGFLAVMLTKGDYALLLNDLGKLPAFLVATLCMGLLGPFGAIPRCIAIAYADLTWYLPSLPMSVFSAAAAVVIWFSTVKRSHVTNLLGRYLGPLKVTLLLAMVALGLARGGSAQVSAHDEGSAFLAGLRGGYSTMDLLAILFFSQLIFTEIARSQPNATRREVFRGAVNVGLIAGGLITIVYIGFALIAAVHGSYVSGVADDTQLSALASYILGPRAGIFANVTIILTCLTTAIALTTTFADFLSQYVFRGRITYTSALAFTVLSSAFMGNLRFSGIMTLVLPWISVCYPALTVFACTKLLIGTVKVNVFYARIAFYLTFFITLLYFIYI